MEIKGTIINVSAPISGTSKAGKEWMKQDFVLETEEKYPKNIVFSRMNKEKIEKYPISLNSKVNVSFDIDAHEYNGKWYNSITAWKVESIKNENNSFQPIIPDEKQQLEDVEKSINAPKDDLPF